MEKLAGLCDCLGSFNPFNCLKGGAMENILNDQLKGYGATKDDVNSAITKAGAGIGSTEFVKGSLEVVKQNLTEEAAKLAEKAEAIIEQPAAVAVVAETENPALDETPAPEENPEEPPADVV